MDTKVDWDPLVGALRNEMQEKGGLIGLLNRQTETLYRRNTAENERLEEQIRTQLELILHFTKDRVKERLKQNEWLKERFSL
jgi:hypothetical protein